MKHRLGERYMLKWALRNKMWGRGQGSCEYLRFLDNGLQGALKCRVHFI